VLGPQIEGHERFPNRTNVSWYTEIEGAERARIRARIFERGVGETLSSGTGATGAAVAHTLERSHQDRATPWPSEVTVVLDGGELEVEVGEDLRVNLTGWAKPVFDGRLSDDFVKELNETE
jgi:diaminopimelate epimerase